MCVNGSNLKEILEKHPDVKKVLNMGYFRKYHMKDTLQVDSNESDVIIQTLLLDGVIQQSPHGYRMKNAVKDELISMGVDV